MRKVWVAFRISSAEPRSLPTIHVPAGIHPLPFAIDEDFGDATRAVDVLAAGVELICIVGVDHGSVAIDLNFGFRKLEFHEFAATLRKLHRAVENRLTV